MSHISVRTIFRLVLFWAVFLYIFSRVPFTQAAFRDLPEDHPNFEAITFLEQRGIISGFPDETFRPNDFVTRGAFLKMAVTTFYDAQSIQNCLKDATSEELFADVPMDRWDAPYLCVGQQKHIVTGYDDGFFHSEKQINFAEGSKMIAIILKSSQVEMPSQYIHEWYEPFVQILEAQNAIPTNIREFDQRLTRADVAEILFRLQHAQHGKSSKRFEDIGVQPILQYYALLPASLLERAYHMLENPTVSLQEFIAEYQTLAHADPFLFTRIGTQEYRFYTNLVFKNQSIQSYLMEMRYENGKLTITKEEPGTRVLLSKYPVDAQSAVEIWQEGNMENMYLVQNDQRYFIDSMEKYNFFQTGYSFSLEFTDVTVSPTGRFIMYTASGWEGFVTRVYDIQKKEKVHEVFTPSVAGFTNDERFFYECQGSGFDSGYVSVYDPRDFDQAIDMHIPGSEQFPIIESCHFDQVQDRLAFTTLDTWENPKGYFHSYSLDTNQLASIAISQVRDRSLNIQLFLPVSYSIAFSVELNAVRISENQKEVLRIGKIKADEVKLPDQADKNRRIIPYFFDPEYVLEISTDIADPWFEHIVRSIQFVAP